MQRTFQRARSLGDLHRQLPARKLEKPKSPCHAHAELKPTRESSACGANFVPGGGHSHEAWRGAGLLEDLQLPQPRGSRGKEMERDGLANGTNRRGLGEDGTCVRISLTWRGMAGRRPRSSRCLSLNQFCTSHTGQIGIDAQAWRFAMPQTSLFLGADGFRGKAR